MEDIGKLIDQYTNYGESSSTKPINIIQKGGETIVHRGKCYNEFLKNTKEPQPNNNLWWKVLIAFIFFLFIVVIFVAYFIYKTNKKRNKHEQKKYKKSSEAVAKLD